MAELPPPPQVSPDGRFYWDGQRWVPIQAHGPSAQSPVAASPVPVQVFPQQPVADAPRKSSPAMRNVSLGCLGLIILVIVLGITGSNSHSPGTASATPALNSESSPLPTLTPINEAQYKASAKSIPYVQLEKDPASLAGTVVTYTGQVVQYDAATTTSHLRINITANSFGYTDTIWLDVDPTQTSKVFRDTVIQFWGEVVGPRTYTSVSGGQITIPEVTAKYVQIVS